MRRLACLLATVGCFALPAASAQAVTGWKARGIAADQQAHVCGAGWWWLCVRDQAPYPYCYGRGAGTWDCYGGETERNRLWRYRNCEVYVWVGRYGETSTPSKYDCS